MPEPENIIPEELLGRRTCLYLGRLHPIKGVDRLLRAWGKLKPSPDWQLVIAGGGDADYRAGLEQIAASFQRSDIHFVGFVSTEVKNAWLRHADLFVLPSHSEAFAMATMEAFAHATPALITSACGFPESAQIGASLEVESSEAGIRGGLEAMLKLNQTELADMGRKARDFVAGNCSWAKICEQLEEVYAWMRGKGDPPGCLRIDE